MDIVDTQVHANRMGRTWKTAGHAETLALTVAAMDAVGVNAMVIAEHAAANMITDPEPLGTQLPNGAWRYTMPFSELAARTYPGRFAYVHRIDPFDPEAADLLAEVRKKPGGLCTRIAPTLDPAQAAAFFSGAFDPFFKAAQKHGVPVFLYLHDTPDAVIPYARKFPDLPLIVDHWGFPMPTAENRLGMDYFEQKVLTLGPFSNVYLKWCKGPRFVSTEAYPHSDLAPYLQRSLEAFGPQRIMWASDITTSKGITTWAEEIHHIRDSNALSAWDKEQIFARTARTVLRWPKTV
jgi:predicted TIM-barrel fold metal-dependent hydrolase